MTRIVCVDFNGVLDAYTGSIDARHVDPPRPGATDRKPAAHVFVDDRAICFRGDFDETLQALDRFAAHWESSPA